MAAKLIGERLPLNWSYGVTRDGRIFFIDDNDQSTTWLHPISGEPIQTGHESSPELEHLKDSNDDEDEDDEVFADNIESWRVVTRGLPPGWEQAVTPEGAIYFIDHNNRCTTLRHPVTGKPVHVDPPQPTRTPPQSPSQIKPRRGSGKSKNIKAPSAARSENSRIMMTGWLHKQESSGLKMWKKKWCVAADYALFVYKDNSEQNQQLSILLPSYKISPCSQLECSRRFSFKLEHENLKTLFFAAEHDNEMAKWVELLRMASLLQKIPMNGMEQPQKLIPKPATMTWNDSDSPLSPPDPHGYPLPRSQEHNVSRTSEDFGQRPPLQSRENTQNVRYGSQEPMSRDGQGQYPNQGHRDLRGSHAYNPSGDYGTLNDSRQEKGYEEGQGRLSGYPGPGLPQRMYTPDDHHRNQGQSSPRSGYSQDSDNYRDRNDRNRQMNDPRYATDNRSRSRLPEDQRSQRTYSQSSNPSQPGRDDPSQRSRGQYSHSSLPRGSKPDYHDNRSSASTLPRQPERMSLRDNRHSQPAGDASFSSLPRNSQLQHPDEASSQSSRQGQRRPGADRQGRELSQSQSPPRSNHVTRDQGRETFPQRSPEDQYMMMTSPHPVSDRAYPPAKHSNRPLPQQPQEPIHERSRSGGGDYASLQRVRDHIHGRSSGNHDTSRSSHDPQSPGSQHSGATSPPRQKPDLYVDIPHTYVNVYNESQGKDNPPQLPSRPPLPAEVRHQIVEDIAQTATPNTRQHLLTAEHNLELRMAQPPYFNYPTPRDKNTPSFAQPPYNDSAPSHQSEQSRSQDGYRNNDQSRYHQGQGGRHDNRDIGPRDSRVAVETQLPRQPARISSLSPAERSDYRQDSFDRDESRDRVPGLSRYQTGERAASLGRPLPRDGDSYQKYMSDLDVRTRTLPSKPIPGATGEKDFRLRSLPDHAQSMPSIFHEQPLSIHIQQESQPSVGSYVNLGPPSIASESRLLVKNENEDPEVRKSAFRPLSSNSLQRHPSQEGSVQNYRASSVSGGGSPPGDIMNGRASDMYPAYPTDTLGNLSMDETADVKRMSSASSQMSQKKGWPSERGYPNQGQGQGHIRQGEGYPRDQGRGKGQRQLAIHTVKEDPNMPDSEVIATELPNKVFPLNGPRLRMSISAGDLLGKTHDELVLLLIQLRRDKAEIQGQRDQVKGVIDKRRPHELKYRKSQNTGQGVIDAESELEHRHYIDLKGQWEELDKKLEVYKPLVNLVSNMVTMGSLYGGDNLMLATEYRKHLLSPDQYSPPKKMLEFSRKQQEDRIVKDIENDVKQLTHEEADLEEKLERLYELDRIMQEQSYQVTSLREDRELLDKAHGGLLKQLSQNLHPQDKEQLLQKQRTVEKELSRVLQQLAQASRELEETTAENNKIEHEVALLRSKVNGDMSRSKSAPSLSSESLRSKMKMEKDLAKVQDIMDGLSKEGARLSEAMNTLRRSSTGGGLMKGLPPPDIFSSEVMESLPPKPAATTYYETDMDTNESKDLAQVTALLASYQLAPGQQADRNMERFQSGAFHSPQTSRDEQTFHASPAKVLMAETPMSIMNQSGEDLQDGEEPWDIGEADDNTKRFFGLIPKNMPKSQTVRDVKRNAEQRREVKKKDDDPPLRIGVISSEYSEEPNIPVYENLPHQKPVGADLDPRPAATSTVATVGSKPWSSVLPDNDTPSTTQRRRSSLHLMAPKPFIPYNSQSNTSTSTPSFAYSSTFSSQPSLSSVNAPHTFAQPPTNITTSLQGQGQISRDSGSPLSLSNTGLVPQVSTSPSAQTWGAPVPRKSALKKTSAPRGRYLTISSSQPIKLETNFTQPPKLKSSAGDLISSMDVPDIVKSSTTNIENFDERTIDREILFFPDKVLIPERYEPEPEDETITEEERLQRKERAEKIRRILTNQSVHSLSQPDVSQVAGEIHERVQQEKIKREQLLAISHELAEQVKTKTRQFAAERRKTWSGTPGVTAVMVTDNTNNNNNNNNARDDSDMYGTMKGDNFDMSQMSNGDLYSRTSPYQDSSYQSNTSYMPQQNFRI